jgi:hypothetical protein
MRISCVCTASLFVKLMTMLSSTILKYCFYRLNSTSFLAGRSRVINIRFICIIIRIEKAVYSRGGLL